MNEDLSWIKIFRRIKEWEWWSDEKVLKVWIYCLITANYEDKQWKGITIERGSFITSFDSLARNCNFSVQQIRTILNKLKSTNDLTIKSTNRNQCITVAKYDKYQMNAEEINKQINKQPNNQSTNKQQTNNKQITTTKEEKNIRSKEEKNKDFPFWLDLETFENFRVMRKKIKSPMTDHAEILVIKRLEEFGIENHKEILEKSIMNSWKGVFELKANPIEKTEIPTFGD